jgi:hypothetical protein
MIAACVLGLKPHPGWGVYKALPIVAQRRPSAIGYLPPAGLPPSEVPPAMTPQRYVEDNVLISTALPAIRVAVAPAFRYIGKFDFRIRDVAAGERHVFADAPAGQVERLFIAQFEGFLPQVQDTYKYSFADAQVFAGQRFKHGAYAFSNRAVAEENPHDEAALTARFLGDQGLTIADEQMMSRFVTVPDAARRHELILYYIENVSPTGHTLAEFYEGEDETPLWQQIAADLTARSLRNFTIRDPSPVTG